MGVESTNAPAVAPEAAQTVLTEYVNGAVQTPVDTKQAIEGEVPTVESEVKPTEPVKSEDKMFGAKFAALSRKEKEQRARDKAFADEKKAFEKMKADLQADYDARKAELAGKYIDPEEFKKDPVGLYKKQGLTFEQLAERVMNDGKAGSGEVLSDTEKRLQAKIEAMEAKLAAKETAEKAKEEEDKQKKFEDTLNSFKTQLTEFCNKEGDYELIRANDAVGLVYEVIEEHHEKTKDENGVGIILSNKEAADAVENYLLEEAKKQLKLNKVKALAGETAVVKTTNEAKTSTTSLSNAHSAQPAPSKGQKLLSDEESRKQAAMLIKWQD